MAIKHTLSHVYFSLSSLNCPDALTFQNLTLLDSQKKQRNDREDEQRFIQPDFVVEI